MSFPNSQLKVINGCKPVKPSRYYCLENDGMRPNFYGQHEIELTASGSEIMQIVSALESELCMEWILADYEVFPKLKPRGKYTLRINNEYTYSVCRKYLYEVGNFEGGV